MNALAHPLFLSFAVAITATLLAILVGVPLAWRLARSQSRWRAITEAIVLLPMALPPTVTGFYLLQIFGRSGPPGRWFELVTGSHIVFTPVAALIATFVAAAPFLVRTAQGAFEQIDHTLLDAARTLGRSERSVFLTVTAPLAWRGIAAGTALCFARAMGEFGTTLMLAGNIPGRTQTASMAVYDAVQAGNTTLALTLSVLMSAVSVVALLMLTSVGSTRRTIHSHRR